MDHIKTNLPQSRVAWLVESKWSELVGLNRQIERIIVFQRAWRWSAVWNLFKDLRKDHYDIVLDLQRILKSGLFSLLAGARRRIGFHRRNAKEFNWIFNNEHISYYSDELPKICHYLKFTEYIGLPKPDKLEFGISSLNPSETAPQIFAQLDQPFIVVVLGTSWESKNWNEAGYAGLIQRILADRKLKIVLVGDKSRSALAAALTEKFPTPNVIDLVGQTTVTQLAALLKAAAAGVGPDSGPGHVAAAVNTPFITLFGPTSPQRTAPFGNYRLVVEAGLSCAPCYKKRCTEHNQQCMKSIQPDEVMEKIALALAIDQ